MEFSIVAISRHIDTFVYYTDVSDATSSLIGSAMSMDEHSPKTWNPIREMEDKRLVAIIFQVTLSQQLKQLIDEELVDIFEKDRTVMRMENKKNIATIQEENKKTFNKRRKTVT